MTPDPLLYDTPLPHVRTFYPMGFPAVIVTNCETIIAAAESVWGRFENRRDQRGVELRIAVSESGSTERPPAAMPRGQGHLVSFIHDAQNFVVCDLRSGFGFGWATGAVASDPMYVRYHFVESCIYLLLESLYLTPVHGACVSLSGKGLLLCGESGAGKSTLAYACAKRGWSFVCDDAAQLIRESSDRLVVGNPFQIRLRPHAMTLFPELEGNTLLKRPQGKPSIELDTTSLNFRIAHQASVASIVFLNRTSSGRQYLDRYDKDDGFTRLSQVVCFGDELLREKMRKSLRRLVAGPIYEMQYYDLDWAEQRLRALMEDDE